MLEKQKAFSYFSNTGNLSLGKSKNTVTTQFVKSFHLTSYGGRSDGFEKSKWKPEQKIHRRPTLKIKNKNEQNQNLLKENQEPDLNGIIQKDLKQFHSKGILILSGQKVTSTKKGMIHLIRKYVTQKNILKEQLQKNENHKVELQNNELRIKELLNECYEKDPLLRVEQNLKQLEKTKRRKNDCEQLTEIFRDLRNRIEDIYLQHKEERFRWEQKEKKLKQQVLSLKNTIDERNSSISDWVRRIQWVNEQNSSLQARVVKLEDLWKEQNRFINFNEHILLVEEELVQLCERFHEQINTTPKPEYYKQFIHFLRHMFSKIQYNLNVMIDESKKGMLSLSKQVHKNDKLLDEYQVKDAQRQKQVENIKDIAFKLVEPSYLNINKSEKIQKISVEVKILNKFIQQLSLLS